jgi:hypothetical protein
MCKENVLFPTSSLMLQERRTLHFYIIWTFLFITRPQLHRLKNCELTAITDYVQRFYPESKRREGRVSIVLVPIRMQVAIPLTSSTVNWNIIHLTLRPFRKNVRTRFLRETKTKAKWKATMKACSRLVTCKCHGIHIYIYAWNFSKINLSILTHVLSPKVTTRVLCLRMWGLD